MTTDWSSGRNERGACRGGNRHEEQEGQNGFHFLSLCIKSQSSSYLSHGGWVRTTNCLGACSCESVSHFIWLSLFSSTDFSQSITHLSRRPQLYTLQWESSPNTATKPTPLPSSMNTNKTSLVRFARRVSSKRRCRNCSSRSSSAAALSV